VNVPDVLPLAIVNVAGTVAEPLELAKCTVRPLVGAAVPRVTVPVDVFPPLTDAGLRVNLAMTGGLTVSTAL